MPLAAYTDVETILQESMSSADQAYTAVYLAQAQQIADDYCNQPLEYDASIAETLEARTGDSYLFLRFPLVDVASVVESGTTLTVDDDYVSYTDGRLRRMSGDYESSWGTLPDAVVVTYAAGYGGAGVSAPETLTLAVALIAAGLLNTGRAAASDGATPVKSVALDGSDQVTYDTERAPVGGIDREGRLTPQVKAMLAPYMKRDV